MARKLVDNIKTTVIYNDHKVIIEVRKATLKDFKTMQGEFLSLIVALQRGTDFNVIDGMDKIVGALSTVTTTDDNEEIPTDEVPLDLLGKVVECVVEANFTPAALASWRSVAEKIKKAAGQDETPTTPVAP